MNTHNICFGSKIRTYFFCYTLLTKGLILASLCTWAGWIGPYLDLNPKDRFSRDKAQIMNRRKQSENNGVGHVLEIVLFHLYN